MNETNGHTCGRSSKTNLNITVRKVKTTITPFSILPLNYPQLIILNFPLLESSVLLLRLHCVEFPFCRLPRGSPSRRKLYFELELKDVRYSVVFFPGMDLKDILQCLWLLTSFESLLFCSSTTFMTNSFCVFLQPLFIMAEGCFASITLSSKFQFNPAPKINPQKQILDDDDDVIKIFL